jgi:hypothetical protein
LGKVQSNSGDVTLNKGGWRSLGGDASFESIYNLNETEI